MDVKKNQTTVMSGDKANYEPLNAEFTAPGAGTVFIYVANESDQSNTNLFLDDFLVVHEKTTSSLNVVSTSNYYPFGMKMDAESYDDVSREKQRYGYNGNEEIAGGGLTLMDFNARIYNPSLGRFMGADALASITAASSPYAFTSNDPINFVDPTGLTERKFGDRVKHYRRIFTREGSFFQRPLYWGRTGPRSSHHWTDQFRSVEANFGLMSPPTFNSFYGIDQMSDQQKADLAMGIGGPGYMVTSDKGTYLYTDKSFQTDFSGGGIENWYRAQDLGAQNMDAGGSDWTSIVQGSLAIGELFRNLKSYQFVGTNANTATDILGDGSFLHNGKRYSIRYFGNQHQGPATIKHAKTIFQNSASVLKGAGKALGAVNVAVTGYQVYGDFLEGKYYSAGTRVAVAGIAAGVAFIPVIGWGVAIGIGVADTVWGDRFYNYVENKFGS